jgi:hypothetical protein
MLPSLLSVTATAGCKHTVTATVWTVANLVVTATTGRVGQPAVMQQQHGLLQSLHEQQPALFVSTAAAASSTATCRVAAATTTGWAKTCITAAAAGLKCGTDRV